MIRRPGSASLALALTVIAVCGCEGPRHNESPGAQRIAPALEAEAASVREAPGKIITTFGEHRIGNTVIEANKSEGKVTVKHLSYKNHPPGGRSTSTSAMSPPPEEWPLEDGWFAYADLNGVYVWLYNGGDKLLLVERKETPEQNQTNIYGTNNLPISIPAQVLDHVKPELKRKLEQTHDRKGRKT